MTDLEIRDIFSRFQNLNLLTLRDNLQMDRVARRTWLTRYGEKKICPVGHGAKGPIALTATSRRMSVLLGVDCDCVRDFIDWWDYYPLATERRQTLLNIIESIWQERLADAEAVQSITGEKHESLTHERSDSVRLLSGRV